MPNNAESKEHPLKNTTSSTTLHTLGREDLSTRELPVFTSAWVTGANGYWGRKVVLSLLRLNWQVIALSRSKPEELTLWAESQGKQIHWQFCDFANPDWKTLGELTTPGALFNCAACFSENIELMMQVNFITPAKLIAQLIHRMQQQKLTGRVGVFLGKNGRQGVPGLGEFGATQGAFWTWSEACAKTLQDFSLDIRLSLVFPPAAPSKLQSQLAERSDHILHKPSRSSAQNADSLVSEVLAGKLIVTPQTFSLNPVRNFFPWLEIKG